MREKLRDKAVEIIGQCREMTVATLRTDGWPQATVVSFVNDGLTLYFGCAAESQKARNIARDPRVSIAMTAPFERWSQIRGISAAGEAVRVTSPVEIGEIGQLMWRRFAAFADVDLGEPTEIAIHRIAPTVLSVLDYSLGFGHADTVVVGDADVAGSHESTRHRWLAPVAEA